MGTPMIALIGIACGVVAGSPVIFGQQQFNPVTVPPNLMISAPLSGAIVNSGTTLEVSVAGSGKYTRIGLVSEKPIGSKDIQNRVPARFSILVPRDAVPHVYHLSAVGVTLDERTVWSAPTSIDVERPDLPASLTAEPPALFLESFEVNTQIAVVGTYTDGTALDVSQSSYVTFSTSNPDIVSVRRGGVVIAGRPGRATLYANYALGARMMHLIVPVTVRARTR
jgi:hypothetical protein